MEQSGGASGGNFSDVYGLLMRCCCHLAALGQPGTQRGVLLLLLGLQQLGMQVLKKMIAFSVGCMAAAASLALRLLYIMRMLKGKNIAENRKAEGDKMEATAVRHAVGPKAADGEVALAGQGVIGIERLRGR